MAAEREGFEAQREALTARGFWSWALQRLSGLFLAFFVGVHVVLVYFLRQGRVDAAGVIERLEGSPLMVTFYAAFVLVVVFHALNGVWGIVLDFGPSHGGRRRLRNTLWTVGVVAVVYGLFVLRALVAFE